MAPRDTGTGDLESTTALRESDATAGNDNNAEAPANIMLTAAFNTVVGMGLGIGIKISAITLFGMSAPVIVGAGLTVGLTRMTWKRICDVRRHNKNNQEDLAGFFDIAKTGHSKKDYLLSGIFAAVASTLGGFLGFEMAEAQIEFNEAIEGLGTAIDEMSDNLDKIEAQMAELQANTEALHEAVIALHDPNEIAERLLQGGSTVSAEEVIDLFQDSKDSFPDNLHGVIDSMSSSNSDVSAQALKDMGYFLANGFDGVLENDVVANKLFEASLEVSDGSNIQAAHDLGYQMLHGNGIDIDYAKAHELLSYANDNGHPLSGEMLQYMSTHNLVPQP